MLAPSRWVRVRVRSGRGPVAGRVVRGEGKSDLQNWVVLIKRGPVAWRGILFLRVLVPVLVSSDLSPWALHFEMFASEVGFLARALGTLI